MKILVASPGRDPAGASTQPASIQAAHWRKSLELAQWQARQRIPPARAGDQQADDASGLPARAGLLANATHPHEGARVAGEAALAPSGLAQSSPAAGPQDPWVSAVLLAAREGVQGGALGLANRTHPIMLTRPPLSGGDAVWRVCEPPASPAQPGQAGFEAAEWPQIVVTASLQGARLSVSIRDGSVNRDDAARLLDRLRQQLRESGIALDSFAVNGWHLTDAEQPALFARLSST